MVENELINYFSKLELNEKRNQISSELENLALLLNSVHKQLNIEKMPSAINYYNKAEDKNMSDNNYLDLIYKNIIYIRKDILTLINEILLKHN